MAKRQPTVQEIIELAAEVEGTVRTDYSGRFMFGKKCMGLVCHPAAEADVIERCIEMRVVGPTRDDMGLDRILYWPEVQA